MRDHSDKGHFVSSVNLKKYTSLCTNVKAFCKRISVGRLIYPNGLDATPCKIERLILSIDHYNYHIHNLPGIRSIAMNFVHFSPDFPPNYYAFTCQLRRAGVTVLGLGETPFEALRPELREAFVEYYRVGNLHNYDELVRALGYFTFRYGKLDRLESHNEYWLESDARLRTDFNIPGFHVQDVDCIKRKSAMKAIFHTAGIPSVRGRVVRCLEEALQLAGEVGYPLVAKPDIGVGATRTYKLHSCGDVALFFADPPMKEYIFEEFIPGSIETFDGLADQDGQIVFCSSMIYNDGMMEIVNQRLDSCSLIRREIPPDLEARGRALVRAYGLRERFFHFEFFRTQSGLIGLEVNMRPPGDLTTDMWNYANDIDIYREYANVVTSNRFEAQATHPYYCAYFGRRRGRAYSHTIPEILAAFPNQVVHHEAICGIFAAAIGDDAILVRSPEREEIDAIGRFILERVDASVPSPFGLPAVP